ncbi:amidohydrolase [Kibdelosporangium banguiense]|uniref:Peptidase M20 domain-containing protein 2 n=1 Tax=Kibdelosporangium banguiense TaxID=1365924 RepID=A0ABS4TKM3_9PSEU|nr:amidohydrolase [Kibdelosporangium banguiense]MBP2324979.1 amidohydrolase [Kibdelosporangium banguiense]
MSLRIPPELLAILGGLRPVLDEVSLDLHARPETRFEEHHAAARLTAELTGAGFEVDKGVAGLPTAFVATHRGVTDGPTIAVLLEYDALPGVGHGCGHNLIAAGGLVAAIAVARTGHPGTLAVIGTPGEEGGGGKILMLDQGVFDGVDAAVMFHPADRSLRARHSLASAHLRVTFHGKAAHAAKAPWEGRSAAAGTQVFFAAIDAMRQFIQPAARIHGIVAHGGDAPNVVPERAEVDLYVRDQTAAALETLIGRVHAAAEGAATATETTVDISETAPRYAERHNNMVMADRIADYTASLGLELEPPSPSNAAGSSDIGNVSARLPIIHPYVQICPRDTPGHSERMRDAAATTEARDATQNMATGLAALVLDLLGDPGLLAAAHAEFTQGA